MPLAIHTTGGNIFNLTDWCMTEKGHSWKHYINFCTDGVWLVVGKMCDVIACA
jgi:hypothetical protein